MAISMKIHGNDIDGWHIVATVPGVLNPSGTKAAWTEDAKPPTWLTFSELVQDASGLQNALNRLASKVQASKPFPKW